MPTVALIQLACGDDPDENLRRGLEMMEEAAGAGAAVVAYPEISFRPFFPRHRADARYFEWAEPIPGPTTERVAAKAAELGVVAVVNLLERAGRGEYYDASPIIDADGSVAGVSRMVHVAEEPGFNEKYYYRPAPELPEVVETAAGRIGVAICYDRHFPELMRALAVDGAEVVISPFVGVASDPGEAYAVEMQGVSFSNQIWVACANRAGREGDVEFAGGSFVTGPSGEVAARAGPNEEILLVECDFEEIDRWRHRRPFLRDRRPALYRRLSERPGRR